MAQKSHKTAFISGIAGQDGAYLADLLLKNGYNVHGLVRWDSYMDAGAGTARLSSLGIEDAVTLHMGDLVDAPNIMRLISDIQPDEIYNLGALSHVHVSFETPVSALDVNMKGALYILEALRLLDLGDTVRFYQASSSEMYGESAAPQNEDTPFAPCSPYAVSKVAAYHLTRLYRQSYGLHASNGVLFNHESPLRGEGFVTQKIVDAVVDIQHGREAPLTLGNLNAVRDWGHARDYVRGMWMMLQQDLPGDYILATGRAISVRDFAERCFGKIGREIVWHGTGLAEQGLDAKTGAVLVSVDAAFYRPLEVASLLGDASKAREAFGWQPEMGLEDLIDDMMQASLMRKRGKEGAKGCDDV